MRERGGWEMKWNVLFYTIWIYLLFTQLFTFTQSQLKLITRTQRNQITSYTLYIKYSKMCEKRIVSRENGVYLLYRFNHTVNDSKIIDGKCPQWSKILWKNLELSLIFFLHRWFISYVYIYKTFLSLTLSKSPEYNAKLNIVS